MLTLKQFIETAISSGIQNDLTEAFFTVDGEQYTILNYSILGRPESYPFEASEYLEDHPDLPEWLVFYTEYEDIQVRKYGIPLFNCLVRNYRTFYSSVVTGVVKDLFEYYTTKAFSQLNDYGRYNVSYENGNWKMSMEFCNGETRTVTGEYKLI